MLQKVHLLLNGAKLLKINRYRISTLVVGALVITSALIAPTQSAKADSVQATADGIFNCSISGTFTVTSNIVSGNTECAGKATILNGVVGIGVEAFASTSLLTEVVIPESVVSIGARAFADTENLRTISVSTNNINYKDINGVLFNETETVLIAYPSNIKDSFDNRITTFDIPNTVEVIADAAFYRANFLTKITIPNSVTTIGDFVFFGATSLTNLDIPNSVETIGRLSLAALPIIFIRIPSSVKSLGDSALAGNSNLRSIEVDENNNFYRSVDGVLFDENQTNLIIYPAAYDSSDIFGYGDNGYIIPNTVTSIAKYAFAGATLLKSVTIPASVTSIGDFAFSRIPGVKSFIFLGNAPVFEANSFYLPSPTPRNAFVQPDATGFTSNPWNSLIVLRGSQCYSVNSEGALNNGESCAGNLVIGSDVTSFEGNAFYGASSLLSVSIPSTVTNIKSGSFGGTSSLREISVAPENLTYKSINGVLFNESQTALILFPADKRDLDNKVLTTYEIVNTVKVIADFAFQQTSLKNVTIPDTVERIGVGAFLNTRSLSTIVLPNSVTSVEEAAFALSTSLTSVTLPTNSDFIVIKDDTFLGTTSLTNIVIPPSVSSIGKFAFYNSGLTQITIPAKVTSIDKNAFTGSANLKDVYMVGNAPLVGAGAFADVATSAIAHVLTEKTGYTKPTWYGLITKESEPRLAGNYLCTIDGTFTIVDKKVTSQNKCTGQAVIPESVTAIEEFAFYDTPGLTSVSLPTSLTTIGGHAFNSAGLTSVIVPNSVTSISAQAFVNLSNLTTATLPSNPNYTTITQGLFLNTPKLASIVIPDSITRIEQSAFQNSGLSTIVIPAGVIELGDSAFDTNPDLTDIYFLGDAPTAGARTFNATASNATAHVLAGKTGFTKPTWYGLIVSIPGDSDPVPTTPIISAVPVIPTYTISYLGNSNNASSLFIDLNSYNSGQQVILTSRTPMRPGHTFLAWNTAANGSGTNYAPSSSFTVESTDISLYAQWKINSYSLSFNGNGGSALKIDSQTRDHGTTSVIPTLNGDQLRLGYTFMGWNSAADGSGKNYLSAQTYTFLAETTLYAQWKTNTYSLTFDGNGHQIGRVPSGSTQQFNSAVVVKAPSQTFTRKGYTSQGWNTSKDGSGTRFAAGASLFQPASNLVLYAHWIPNTYQVRFLVHPMDSLPNGQFVTGGSIASGPKPGARPGYVFKGWRNTASPKQIVTFPYAPRVMRNISLYAVWEKNK